MQIIFEDEDERDNSRGTNPINSVIYIQEGSADVWKENI